MFPRMPLLWRVRGSLSRFRSFALGSALALLLGVQRSTCSGSSSLEKRWGSPPRFPTGARAGRTGIGCLGCWHGPLAAGLDYFCRVAEIHKLRPQVTSYDLQPPVATLASIHASPIHPSEDR